MLFVTYAGNYQEYHSGHVVVDLRTEITEKEKEGVTARLAGKTREAMFVKYGDGSRGIRLK